MLHFKTGLTPANFISVLLKLSQLTKPLLDQAHSEQQRYSFHSWQCFPLFSKDTKGEVGQKDDPLPPLSLPIPCAARGEEKEDKKHHSIQGNPLDKWCCISSVGGSQGVFPFCLQMGIWNRLNEIPWARAGQWEARNWPSPWSLPLQRTTDSSSHCPLPPTSLLSPPCFSEKLCPALHFRWDNTDLWIAAVKASFCYKGSCPGNSERWHVNQAPLKRPKRFFLYPKSAQQGSHSSGSGQPFLSCEWTSECELKTPFFVSSDCTGSASIPAPKKVHLLFLSILLHILLNRMSLPCS